MANFPLAALQRVGLAGAAAHLTNLLLPSRHGAASAGVENSPIEAAASNVSRIIVLLPPWIRQDERIMPIGDRESGRAVAQPKFSSVDITADPRKR